MLLPKSPKIRNKKHLVWLRELPCAFCKSPAPSEASHIRLHGMAGVGMKSSDSRALPSCHECHMEAHRLGERTFYGGDLEEAIKLSERLYERTGQTDQALWMLIGWRE